MPDDDKLSPANPKDIADAIAFSLRFARSLDPSRAWRLASGRSRHAFRSHGFTHYPRKRETYRYFKGNADLPPRIVMLEGSGSFTFDVLTWLNQQKVPR
jgi:hypothetical protein